MDLDDLRREIDESDQAIIAELAVKDIVAGIAVERVVRGAAIDDVIVVGAIDVLYLHQQVSGRVSALLYGEACFHGGRRQVNEHPRG